MLCLRDAAPLPLKCVVSSTVHPPGQPGKIRRSRRDSADHTSGKPLLEILGGLWLRKENWENVTFWRGDGISKA